MEDYSTDCSKSAKKTGKILKKMADPSEYIGGSYNTGELTNFINLLSIELISTFDDCQYTSFMAFVNNRFNDSSFLYGLVANLLT